MKEQDLRSMIDGCDAFITGGDNELWDGMAMEGYGKRLIRHELGNPFHWGHALHGIKNYSSVLDATKESHTKGLGRFFEIVGEINCADKDFAYNATKDYIEKHQFDGVDGFLGYIDKIGDVYLVTLGSQIAADVAKERYGLADGIGNPVTYDDPEATNPIITGCEINVNEENKFEVIRNLLEENGYLLKNCGFIGSGRMDWPFIGNVKLFIASPNADHVTIQRAHHWIDNYEEVANLLENAQ